MGINFSKYNLEYQILIMADDMVPKGPWPHFYLLDPWSKDQVRKSLISAILPQQLQNLVTHE